MRRVAIVPALNEAQTIARVVEEIRAVDPGFEILVIDDGSTDGTAGRGGARRSARRTPSLQRRHRRRRPDRLPVRARPRLPGRRPDRRRRAARSRRARPAARADRRRTSADMVVGSRFRGARPVPRPVRAQARDSAPVRRRLADRPAADDRSDLRLPRGQPPRHRALRRRLPARLSRGRGERARVPPPAEDRRGARGDAHARRRPLLDHGSAARSTT